MVASPQSPSSIRPGGKDWGELRQHEVQEVTYPRQSEPLQELAEQCKQSLRAMPQVAYANQLNEVVPQCLCRFKRSFHFQMRCAQCKEITVLHLLHGRKMEHGGLNKLIHRWFQTKAQPRKQAQRRGALLAELAASGFTKRLERSHHPAA